MKKITVYIDMDLLQEIQAWDAANEDKILKFNQDVAEFLFGPDVKGPGRWGMYFLFDIGDEDVRGEIDADPYVRVKADAGYCERETSMAWWVRNRPEEVPEFLALTRKSEETVLSEARESALRRLARTNVRRRKDASIMDALQKELEKHPGFKEGCINWSLGYVSIQDKPITITYRKFQFDDEGNLLSWEPDVVDHSKDHYEEWYSLDRFQRDPSDQ